MKWTGIYLAGYFVLIIGVVAGLWKSGFVERVGVGWIAIGVVIAIGAGIMMAVSRSGAGESVGK